MEGLFIFIDMKIMFFILLSLTLLCNCTTNQPKVLLTQVTLEDGFDNDTISIFFGNDTIINSYEVSSDQSTGSTDVRIELFDSARTLIMEDGHKNNLKSIRCLNDCLTKPLILLVDHKTYTVQIDITNKYVGVSKVGKDSIRFNKQNTMHFYD